MARTRKRLHLDSVKRICADAEKNSELESIDFDSLKKLNSGSTSIVFEHPRYPTMVLGFTTDKAKIDWFKENRKKLNFELIQTEMVESIYDEIHKYLYCFKMKKLEALSPVESAYVQKEILSKYSKMDFHPIFKGFAPNMRVLSIAKQTADKKFKSMLFKLKKFLEKNSVEMELLKSSFLKTPQGDIIMIDPVYSTKERI